MAVMSGIERWACCNPIWRAFTGRPVIPWVLAGRTLAGEVLELGTGAGANAAALLRRFPTIQLTATDVDPFMLDAAGRRLAPFGHRASVRAADATKLEFANASFDGVVCLLMLHHVGDWEAALTEAFRVLRPGGHLVGYDLARSGPTDRLHGHDDPGHNSVTVQDLRRGLETTGYSTVDVSPSLKGLVVRFWAGKA